MSQCRQMMELDRTRDLRKCEFIDMSSGVPFLFSLSLQKDKDVTPNLEALQVSDSSDFHPANAAFRLHGYLWKHLMVS